MALPIATTAWEDFTLTKNEIWWVRRGAIRVHCFGGAAPDNEDGMDLPAGQSVALSAGQTVWVRRGRGHESSDCTFARVEIQ